MIRDMKKDTPIEEICEGCPSEFTKYLQYCRNLKFEDKPCLADIRKLFKNLMKKEGYQYDYQFDWVIKKQEKSKRKI